MMGSYYLRIVLAYAGEAFPSSLSTTEQI